jgi:multisubunit Na+/H+ antiporter MnhF subunit
VTGLNPAWLAAGVAMILALALPLWTNLRAGIGHRLVAVQMASVVVAWVLVALSLAFSQPSFLDLAVTLGLLSVPGTLVFALFAERWL